MTEHDPIRRVDASTDEAGVLELLGFAAPVTPPASAQIVSASAAVPSVADAVAAPVAPASPVAPAPTSRRELREREREAVAPAASASTGSRTPRRAPRRAPRMTAQQRRDQRRFVAEQNARRAASSSRGGRARTIGSRLLSVGALIFAGALAIGMSVPANAFGPSATDATTASTSAAGSAAEKSVGQSVEIASSVAAADTARDGFTVTSWAQMLVQKYGTRDYNYTMGAAGPIRWPFPYVVPISSGFGERAAPCGGCSSMHMGLDFTPGEGAPIYAMADGVVAVHDDDSGGYGNHVYIDHGDLLGDGSDIQSLYAHMQHGSSPLVVGQQIKVGDFIGLVGRTGTATGNHLHFEVLVSGTQVDPFAWLKKHTA